jgi:hypothetical protein
MTYKSPGIMGVLDCALSSRQVANSQLDFFFFFFFLTCVPPPEGWFGLKSRVSMLEVVEGDLPVRAVLEASEAF